jgi:hypothetical protein
MSSAALKGCHDVQNLGATISYLRRYLWVNCFEICEHDALDATTGSSEPAKKTVTPVTPPKPAAKPIVGQVGEWQITAPAKPEGESQDWLDLIQTSAHMLLDLTANKEDVLLIFKKNKVLFDTVKATDAAFFKNMMVKFTERNNMFTEE